VGTPVHRDVAVPDRTKIGGAVRVPLPAARQGDGSKLHIPKDVPVAIFWSVTVYDPITASGLDSGQPFPSLNAMDKPAQNADARTVGVHAGGRKK
jgi:hypothetical protein